MPREKREVTAMLRQLDLADVHQGEQLLAVIYDELHRLAAGQMNRERVDHTLQPTALVHEAFLRLVDIDDVTWEGRAHFYGVAARAMRQILVDHARRVGAEKRGGNRQRVTFDDDLVPEAPAGFDLLDLHEAIGRLDRQDPALGRMIDLRFFSGLTLDETAQVLGVSRRKVAKDWAFARLWLSRELLGGGAHGS
jgi:RNA polymerase sigma factor (TIGR02999 family)